MISVIIFLAALNCFAQIQIGVEYVPSSAIEEPKKEEEKKMKKDVFVDELAKYFNVDAEKLHNLRNKGYGRFELTRLLLISSKTAVEFDEVIKKRANKRIAEIAKDCEIDYSQLYDEARCIKTIIIKNMKQRKLNSEKERTETGEKKSEEQVEEVK